MAVGKMTMEGSGVVRYGNEVNRVAIISRCCKIATFQGPDGLSINGRAYPEGPQGTSGHRAAARSKRWSRHRHEVYIDSGKSI
jgi:hypothetical protein